MDKCELCGQTVKNDLNEMNEHALQHYEMHTSAYASITKFAGEIPLPIKFKALDGEK